MNNKLTSIFLAIIALAMLFLLPLDAAAKAASGNSRQFSPFQPSGFNSCGITELKALDDQLTGKTVNIGVICRSLTYDSDQPQNDYRPNISHKSFKSAELTFHDNGLISPKVSYHSTGICSVLFGSEPNVTDIELGQFEYRGIIPQATGDIYEFWHFLTSVIFPQKAPSADIITASIGTSQPSWWTRGIESMVENHGTIFVSSIGNGTESYDRPLYPAASANVIGAGVVDSLASNDLNLELRNFANVFPWHSSFGPTFDDRTKPDLVAIGNFLVADDNSIDGYETTGNWSSFASPTVAGAVGLLVDKAKQDSTLSDSIFQPVMKSILLSSAKKLPFWHKGLLSKLDDHEAPLDFLQGAGLLNVRAAYDILVKPYQINEASDIGWSRSTVGVDSPQSYIITTSQTQQSQPVALSISLCWLRHYQNSYPFNSIGSQDSNLRLELWSLDSDNKEVSLVDYSDSLADNVEHIYFHLDNDNGNTARYKIIVLNHDSHEEPYGLSWSTLPLENAASRTLSSCDLNGDGKITQLDIDLLTEQILKDMAGSASYCLGDINNDGEIDFADAAIIKDHIADPNAAQ